MWFLQGGSWKGQVIILTYTPPRLNMVPEKNYLTPSKGKTSHKSSNHPSDLNEGRETRGFQRFMPTSWLREQSSLWWSSRGDGIALNRGGLENQRYQKQPFMNETTFCLRNGWNINHPSKIGCSFWVPWGSLICFGSFSANFEKRAQITVNVCAS